MSKDTIYREDAIKAIEELPNAYNGWSDAYDKAYIIGTLEEVPSTDIPKEVIAQITFDEEKLREIVKEAVERFKEEYEIADRPQGEWIEHPQYGTIQCDQCTVVYNSALYPKNFCPNCGARMKGADDE